MGWLAGWIENVQNQNKYIMLAANSKLKGEKDWKKYEVARKLHAKVDKIRACYRDDMKSKEMRIRQRAVAMYFIDKVRVTFPLAPCVFLCEDGTQFVACSWR